MRVISFKEIFREIWKKRGWTLICVIVCAVMGLALGFVLTRKAAASADAAVLEYQAQLEEYEADLAEYDNSIQAYEENLATLQEQYDAQKEYCENSIYMQLDSTAFWVGEVQYTVTTEGNLSYTLSALTSYINGSEMRSLIAQKVDGIDESYLKEILITSTSGNTLTIDVYHYDENAAQELLDAIEKIMENSIDTISNAQGEYSLEKVSASVSVKADSAILTAQNTQLNNLRTYTTNLSDTKNSLSNKQQEKANYIAKTSLDIASSYRTLDWIKGIFKYFVLGIVAGIVAMFVWQVLKSIFGRKLQSRDYLEALGMHIIGCVKPGGEMVPSVERSCLDMELLSGKERPAKVCIGILTRDQVAMKECTDGLLTAYRENLSRADMQLYVGGSELEAIEELKEISTVGKVILLVQIGNTTYDQIDRYLDLCNRYHIAVLGAIVME